MPSFNLACWPHCNLQPGQACVMTSSSGTRELCPMLPPPPRHLLVFSHQGPKAPASLCPEE